MRIMDIFLYFCCMVIPRDKYLQELKSVMHNGMIKIITGVRRCGKSYLLFELFKKYLLETGVIFTFLPRNAMPIGAQSKRPRQTHIYPAFSNEQENPNIESHRNNRRCNDTHVPGGLARMVAGKKLCGYIGF